MNSIIQSPLTQSELDAKLKGQTLVDEYYATMMEKGYYPAKKVITDRIAEEGFHHEVGR